MEYFVITFYDYMKRFFFAFLFTIALSLLFFSNTIGQINAEKYFYYTNRAELSIVDSNYIEAIKNYDSSLAYLPVPFSQDVYNATICYTLQKQYEKAFAGIKFLIQRGVDSTIFQKQVFKRLRNQKSYWREFISGYPKLLRDYKMNIQMDILTDINRMNEADQNFFCELPQNVNNNYFIDSLKQNDDFLMIRFKMYLNKYTYLHEGIIGVKYADTTLSFYPIFNILLRHHYQNQKFEITPILKNALKSGYLKPELYALWVDFQTSGGYGSESLVKKIEDTLYIFSFPGIKNKIDANRSAIGLCTLDEQAKKTIFTARKNSIGFLFFSRIGIITSHPDPSVMSWLNKFSVKVPIKTT
jgi:hypothetical protein